MVRGSPRRLPRARAWNSQSAGLAERFVDRWASSGAAHGLRRSWIPKENDCRTLIVPVAARATPAYCSSKRPSKRGDDPEKKSSGMHLTPELGYRNRTGSPSRTKHHLPRTPDGNRSGVTAIHAHELRSLQGTRVRPGRFPTAAGSCRRPAVPSPRSRADNGASSGPESTGMPPFHCTRSRTAQCGSNPFRLPGCTHASWLCLPRRCHEPSHTRARLDAQKRLHLSVER